MRGRSNKIYEWNDPVEVPAGRIRIVDETLRDGLQAGYIRTQPSIGLKRGVLHAMGNLGVDVVALGYPASVDDSEELARYVAAHRFKFSTYCIGRTKEEDVKAILDVRDKTGIENMSAALFVGSSPIRFLVEKWNIKEIVRRLREAVSFAVKEGLPVILVTEDTIRAKPKTLRRIYSAGIDEGATEIVAADTVGYAKPSGVHNLITFLRQEIIGDQGISLHWHGHNDQGYATVNAAQAIWSGADTVHAAALGTGERAGNTAMHQLLQDLHSRGVLDRTNISLPEIMDYSELVAGMCDIDIPPNEPVIGSGVFTTATGIHAAAIAKASGPDRDQVYSAVPAGAVGRAQNIVIGPQSGRANIVYVLAWLGFYMPSDEQVARILRAAKDQRKILTKAEILDLLS